MRVFLTGVTGFIGGCLARRLAADGHEVAGLARLTSRPEADLPVRLYRGSLVDREAVRWAVWDFQPQAVLHLGAVTPVAYSFDHPQEVVETNLIGTINLAEACRRETAIERFIFASSMEVYGGCLGHGELFTETDTVCPTCPYAVAKLAAERYLAYLGVAYRFPWLALRQTNTYGRAFDDRFVVEATVTRMLRGGPISMGDPRPVRNFLFIDDLVALYCRLLEVDFSEVRSEIYNTGPANGVTIKQLVLMCADAVGWWDEVRWQQFPPRPGEVFYLNATGEKLQARTGWRPIVTLEDGLGRVVRARRPDASMVTVAIDDRWSTT